MKADIFTGNMSRFIYNYRHSQGSLKGLHTMNHGINLRLGFCHVKYRRLESPHPHLSWTMSRQSDQPRSVSYQLSRPGSRAIYPSFLPLQDTLKLQLLCAWRGLLQAFRWDLVLSIVTRHDSLSGHNNFLGLTLPFVIVILRFD
jgi:hypothetical protein